MKRKIELVELGIPHRHDATKSDEITRKAKKARVEGRLKFDHQKLLPDCDNPFQRQETDPAAQDEEKVETVVKKGEVTPKSDRDKSRDKRKSEGCDSLKRHSDYRKDERYSYKEKHCERNKDRSKKTREQDKSGESSEKVVDQEGRETDVNLNHLVCDSWSQDNEDTTSSPYVEDKSNETLTPVHNKRSRIHVTSNENSEFPSDFQDESRQDKLHNTCKAKRNIPHHLLKLMYQSDLSVLCSLRKSTYEYKYPLLSLTFEDSEIDKFNDIVLRYEEKSFHLRIEYVDKYYTNNDIDHAKLFNKREQSFSINNYFDSYVKHLTSKVDSSFDNIEYLVICTNSGLDLTEENELKKGRSRNFYPFKFDSVSIEECGILKDFLFTNDNKHGRGFYKFSQNKTTRDELLKRLEFSSAALEVMEKGNFSQEKVKELFLDRLVFAVNQPNREELNSIIKSEIEKNSKVQYDYIALHKEILRDLTASEKYKKLGPELVYEFNLLMLFLHDMFVHKDISPINPESYGISNEITINYDDGIIYIKAHNAEYADGNIGYSQLFPSKRMEKNSTLSINKHFALFVEELKNKDIKYFVIYTNADLDLTEEKKLKKGQSIGFYPLKFDNIDLKKKKYRSLRNYSFMNKNGLYRFAQEEDIRKRLLGLLELPSSLQKEKILPNENKQEIKEIFLNRLIFATNQPNREQLNNIIKDEIDKSDVPYLWLGANRANLEKVDFWQMEFED